VALAITPQYCQAQGSATAQVLSDAERALLFPDRDRIEQGRTVAEAACGQCHGMDGISDSPGKPHLAGQRTVYLHRVLKAYISDQRPDETRQHSSSFLNEEALLAVSVYYASLPPARQPEDSEKAMPPENLGDDPFTGIKPALKKCNRCHGDTGNSKAGGMPNLTAQDPDYFESSMKAYLDGGRKHKLMQKLVAALDEATIREMGVYYAVQEPLATETVGDGDAEAGRAASEPCASCHGADGNASGADMPSLAGQDARYFSKAMQAYKKGEREHEAMFNAADPLNDQQISDMATFYASQQPAQRSFRKPLTSAEWIERCDRCHGLDGNSSDPRFPMLAGQDAVYLKNVLRAYADQDRGDSIMHAMSNPLSESDVERIVAYYASQEAKAVVYMRLPCEDDGAN
jgi:cytochrome c553